MQTFKYQKNIRIHAFNEEGMSRIRTAGMCGATASKSLWLKGDPAGPDLHLGRSRCATVYEHLGIETVLVDPKRTFMSISVRRSAKTRSATGNIFLPK